MDWIEVQAIGQRHGCNQPSASFQAFCWAGVVGGAANRPFDCLETRDAHFLGMAQQPRPVENQPESPVEKLALEMI
jgi:hypothetical protein